MSEDTVKKAGNQKPGYVSLIFNILTTAFIFYYMGGKNTDEDKKSPIDNYSKNMLSTFYFEKTDVYQFEQKTIINDITYFHNEDFIWMYDNFESESDKNEVI